MSEKKFFASIEIRVKYTHFSAALCGIYHGNVKLMDCIANLNILVEPGVYPLSVYNSPKFKRDVLLLDVPGHPFIEIHPADYAHELKGCFAPGSFEVSPGRRNLSMVRAFAESNSTAYLDELMAYVAKHKVEYVTVSQSECINVYFTGRA